MQIKSFALLALLGAAVPMTAASAMMIAKPDAVASASMSTTVHKADYKDRSHYKRRKFNHKRRHYTPGGRYDRAPSHWHRYHARPHDWRTRGCIIVGPIWWCP